MSTFAEGVGHATGSELVVFEKIRIGGGYDATTVHMLHVPRVGESVRLDDLWWTVKRVRWEPASFLTPRIFVDLVEDLSEKGRGERP